MRQSVRVVGGGAGLARVVAPGGTSRKSAENYEPSWLSGIRVTGVSASVYVITGATLTNVFDSINVTQNRQLVATGLVVVAAVCVAAIIRRRQR